MLSIDDFLPYEERCTEVLRELRWADGLNASTAGPGMWSRTADTCSST